MASENKYQIEKLNNDNYFVWKFKLEMLLEKEGNWQAVQTPKPNDSVWEKQNKQAMATIVLLVENSQLVHIRKHRTAKEMWDALKSYHERGAGNNSVQIIKEICTGRLEEGGNMEKHINWLTDCFQKLDDLDEEKLSERWKIGLLFGQLPRSYDTIVTALSTQSAKDLTIKNVA